MNMDFLREWWDYLGKYVPYQVLIALAALISLIISWWVTKYIVKVVFSVARKVAKSTKTRLDDEIVRLSRWPITSLIYFTLAYIVISLLGIVAHWITIVYYVIVSLSISWLAWSLVNLLNEVVRYHEGKPTYHYAKHLIPLLKTLLKIIIATLGISLALEQLGYSVSSIVAGLGIGGIALALAARDTLSNFFGSLMLFVDKPFTMDDWVKIGDTEGVVIDVGLRSTRVRTFDRAIVTIPNSIAASQKIENFSLRDRYRIDQVIDIVYQTPPDLVVKFVDGIRKIISSYDITDKSDIRIWFREFGASSLKIYLTYFTYVKGKVYPEFPPEYRETMQRINLDIMELAYKLGISFAYPTQSIFIEQWPSPPSS